jgi:hypothetical protein
LEESWKSFGRVLEEFWKSFGRVLEESWRVALLLVFNKPSKMIGTEQVAVVKDLFERKQESMHLLSIINIVDRDKVMVLGSILGENNPRRRLVDIYSKDPKTGNYFLLDHDIEFGQFLTQLGFSIIPTTLEEEKQWGLNFLNGGHGNLLILSPLTAEKLRKTLVNTYVWENVRRFKLFCTSINTRKK